MKYATIAVDKNKYGGLLYSVRHPNMMGVFYEDTYLEALERQLQLNKFMESIDIIKTLKGKEG